MNTLKKINKYETLKWINTSKTKLKFQMGLREKAISQKISTWNKIKGGLIQNLDIKYTQRIFELKK